MYMMPASTCTTILIPLTHKCTQYKWDTWCGPPSTPVGWVPQIWVWLRKYYVYIYTCIYRHTKGHVSCLCTVIFTGRHSNGKLLRCSATNRGNEKTATAKKGRPGLCEHICKVNMNLERKKKEESLSNDSKRANTFWLGIKTDTDQNIPSFFLTKSNNI